LRSELTFWNFCQARDEDQRTALFLTAMAGHVPMVEALIALKADKEATDKLQFTPLMAAAAAGQVKVLEAFIKAKANLEATHQKVCSSENVQFSHVLCCQMSGIYARCVYYKTWRRRIKRYTVL